MLLAPPRSDLAATDPWPRPDRPGTEAFSHLPLDRPLSAADFPDPASVQAARSRAEVILNLVRRDKPTLRQLLGYLAGARGHFVTAGTPEQIAELIEDWFTDGAAGSLAF